MSEKIFSGKSSRKFWNAINRYSSQRRGKDKYILFDYGCKAQEIEYQRDELLDACKKAKIALNLCARVFLGTGKTPEPDVMADAIIEIDVAIAKCEKEPA